MGFWVMLIAFAVGVTLIIYGLKNKNTLIKFPISALGVIAIAFAVYLGWPK